MANTESGIWDRSMKFLLILLLVCNTAFAKEFNTTPQDIETINTPRAYKTVVYDKRYSFSVPAELDVKRAPEAEIKLLFIVSPENKAVLGVNETPTFNKPEDYGLDITRRELVSAFYDNNQISDKDVIATRNEIFKSSLNISVYKRAGFIFFRRDTNQQTLITISSPVRDDIIVTSFFTKDEELLMNFIKSFKAK